MHERAKTICKTVVEDLNDPFQVAVITSSDLDESPSRFFDEANAMSMMGGRRLVRVKHAGDKLTTTLKDYLKQPNPDALVVIEAGDLGPRSTLRKLVEAEKSGAATVPCYVDDNRSIGGIIEQTVRHAGFQIDRDAMMWLSDALAGDRQRIRRDLDKLITYMGPHVDYQGVDGPPITENMGRVTMEDAMACCADVGATELDAFMMAVGGRNGVKTQQIYEKLKQEDVSFITVLRVLQNHFRRLHIVRTKLDAGDFVDNAMKSLNPPVFFKQADAFKAQTSGWSTKAIENILRALVDLEKRCKQTGSMPETLIGQFLVSVTASR